jgi:hypothetical protein
MDETHDSIETLPETEKVLPAVSRRKWQTPRVLLADATIVGAQMMCASDGNTGSLS